MRFFLGKFPWLPSIFPYIYICVNDMYTSIYNINCVHLKKTLNNQVQLVGNLFGVEFFA